MYRTPLYNIQQRSGAAFTHLFDWEIAEGFGNVASEYQAVHHGTAILDRSYIGRFQVTGKDALDLLNRLSSYKVDVLPPGSGAGAILTTSKGRVIDVLHLFSTNDGLLMLTSPQVRQRVAEWIDLYTFLEEAALEDITESTAMVTVLGPQAASHLEGLCGVDLSGIERYGSASVRIADMAVSLLRSDALEATGYDLVVPVAQAEALWSALVAESNGGIPIGEAAFNALRIEAGLPRYGWEISEEVNPWEVNLQQYIHFEKGCYIGQEVILRLNTYDKVRRRLMRLAFSDASVSEGARLQRDGRDAGVVTSVTRHPVSEEYVGLGLIRTPFAKEGAELDVVNTDDEATSGAIASEAPSREAALA